MRILGRLFRLRLVLMNGVAALGGYMLFPGRPEAPPVLALFLGVSLLAAAGSALNQVLEREPDSLMRRTMNRPLPRGEMGAATAAAIGAACLAAGTTILAGIGGAVPAAVGGVTLLWYLAVYTPLKRRTPLALAAGALCGTAPPVIGWCVAGGNPADFRVVLLAGTFYLWQVPHFWLLQRRHAEEYRRAGFPLFEHRDAGGRPGRLCLLWIAATIAAAVMLPAFGVISGSAPLWSALFCAPLLLTWFRRSESALSASVHLFPALVTIALCAGR